MFWNGQLGIYLSGDCIYRASSLGGYEATDEEAFQGEIERIKGRMKQMGDKEQEEKEQLFSLLSAEIPWSSYNTSETFGLP